MTNPILIILTIPLIVIFGLLCVCSVILIVWGAQALIKSRWKVCVFSDEKCEWAGKANKIKQCQGCVYYPWRKE